MADLFSKVAVPFRTPILQTARVPVAPYPHPHLTRSMLLILDILICAPSVVFSSFLCVLVHVRAVCVEARGGCQVPYPLSYYHTLNQDLSLNLDVGGSIVSLNKPPVSAPIVLSL